MASQATASSYGFVPWLASVAVGLLARTWRVDVVEGREVLERVLTRREPMVWCVWHNRIGAGAGLFVRRMVPSGTDYTLLTSASRDGALSAAVAAGRGRRVVRGSSSRGGARALLDVIRTVKGHGSSPILVPDGPRGPAYEVKPGVLKIAAKTGLPILGVGFAARRAWVLRSWDRLIVPKPFTRIVVTLAEPLPVPDGLSEEELGRVAGEVKEILDRLCRRAEAAVGASDPFSAAG